MPIVFSWVAILSVLILSFAGFPARDNPQATKPLFLVHLVNHSSLKRHPALTTKGKPSKIGFPLLVPDALEQKSLEI